MTTEQYTLSSLHSHLGEDSVSHYSSCPGRGIAEWEILKQGQSFSECVSKLFQLPAAQQWLTPLPFCLLRGLQGGISPNYLYWSRETVNTKQVLIPFTLLISHPTLSSFHPPPCLQKETGSFYVRCTVLTTTTHHCISCCSDLLFAFRLLWLNLPCRCSSFTSDWVNRNGEWLFFCLQSTVVLSPQHTNHCGCGKDTPLGPTLS